MPGHTYANVRQPLVHTLNLAHLMPLSSVWTGPTRNTHLDGPPLLHASTAGSTPFRRDRTELGGLILDEAWTFLDHPLFAARIREWLKVLRKAFATGRLRSDSG